LQQRNQNGSRPIRQWRRFKPHCRHIGKRIQTSVKTLLQTQMSDLQTGGSRYGWIIRQTGHQASKAKN
jgi:hypothetical protein